ncbi:MAG TPA: hypothetical protein VFZ34_14490 [Blastocatellia bacterium]|nr:hypothetical protein [Blastocatellia bacterium]
MKYTLTRRNFVLAFLGLSLFVVSCSKPVTQEQVSKPSPNPTEVSKVHQSPSPQLSADGKLKQYIPKSIWVDIFFETINKRAKSAGLSDLRSAVLPDGDLELRVWGGFGITTLQGFILRKKAGVWQALDLSSGFNKVKNDLFDINDERPKPALGWDHLWTQLASEGILILPDAEAIDCSAMINDGISYVVEINMNHTYRTYMYDNPNYAKCPEAKQIMKVARIIWGQMCGEKKHE